jgi:hypothetical protein
VNVEVDTGEGKFFSFGFAKFDNPDLTQGNAAGMINGNEKTIDVTVWYPVENIASYKLIPSFETNGATVSVDGTELQSGNGAIDFTELASSAEFPLTKKKTLMVQRPGFDPVSYQLSVTFKEDPDTDRSITDFRFNAAINYGIQYTALGEITPTGDTGTITVKVHYTGDVPAALVPSFVSPGTVSVDGVTQQSDTGSRDFSEPLYYRVVSHDENYSRTYRVTVDFVNEADARPKLNGFTFTTAANPSLAAATSALIDHEAGLVVIEAVYTGDSPPTVLVPAFSAGGNVSVAGMTQQSGVSAQNFSGKVKYTVRDPGNPNLFRDYWVDARFVQDSLSLAELSEFRFFAADNSGLFKDVTATIDQAAGTIYAILPFTNLGPDGGHRKLYPRWLGRGTVSIGGAVQTSGQGGFSFQAVYRVTSADGAFFKDYTVKVLEVNTRIYVNAGAAGDNTGVSWANAFRSLADACKAAEHLPTTLPAEVWIAEGTYRPDETRDAAAYLKVSPNTGYYGGFAGTETTKEARDLVAHQVTVTGDLGGGVYAGHLFMNNNLQGGNAAFGEMKLTGARALTAG